MEFVREIWENDQEYMTIIEDLLKNEKLLKLDEITHHHYTTRLTHSLFVSYMSYKLAKSRGLDYISTARAGLLHDFFLEGRDEISELGLGSHNSAHPKIALKNARKITEINELEKDIILKHMFLCTPNVDSRFKRVYCDFIDNIVQSLAYQHQCHWFKEFIYITGQRAPKTNM